jgi:hypothetical protein
MADSWEGNLADKLAELRFHEESTKKRKKTKVATIFYFDLFIQKLLAERIETSVDPAHGRDIFLLEAVAQNEDVHLGRAVEY